MRQIDGLIEALANAGIRAKTWRDRRVYLFGLHKTISAHFDFADPVRTDWLNVMDGVTLHVESTWRSNKSDLHAKGVKHGLLKKLHEAGLTPAPPNRWRDVSH